MNTQRSQSKSVAELAADGRFQMETGRFPDGATWYKFKYRSGCWTVPFHVDQARAYLLGEPVSL